MLAANGDIEADFDALVSCSSARSSYPMPDDSAVRVAAIQGLQLSTFGVSSFGWPIRFVEMTVQQGVDVQRDPKVNVGRFSAMPDRLAWSWRDVVRSWRDPTGRPRTITFRWTALLFSALVLSLGVLAASAMRSRGVKTGAWVIRCSILLGIASLAVPTNALERRSTVLFMFPGQAAPTGYSLAKLRAAVGSSGGRAAFAQAAVSVVDHELVAPTSATGIFFRRTAESGSKPDDFATLRPNAPLPPNGWPDSTGVAFVVTSPLQQTDSRLDRWGVTDRAVLSRLKWSEPLPSANLGIEASPSLFGWSVRWSRNSASGGERWILAVDRLAERVGVGLIGPVGLLASRCIWFDLRTRRRRERGECLGCSYSLNGLPRVSKSV